MSSQGRPSLAGGNRIGGCCVEMGPLGRVVNHKEQVGLELDQIQVPGWHLAATGLGWPCWSFVYLWLVCIMLSVVYLHGTYPPSRLRFRSQERSAKHSVGGLGEKTETLDRLAVVVHQMLAACASQVI